MQFLDISVEVPFAGRVIKSSFLFACTEIISRGTLLCLV